MEFYSKALNKIQTFEANQYFPPDYKSKTAYYKISKKKRIAIANVVGSDKLDSSLRVITLLLITKLIFKYKSP